MYKRMSPDDIVRLSPGDEIIVVLPAVHSRLPTEAIRVIAHYQRLFSRVINLSLPDTVHRADRTNIVTEIIRDNHSFLRADLHFLEFSCRAKSYPIREHLGQESFDEALVNRWCDQGAGIDLSVCGYTASHTVLLQLRFIPYVQVYRRTPPECFLNDAISFNSKVRQSSSLDAPFLHQLSIFDGCSHSTLEILWKYYRASHTITQALLASKAVAASKALGDGSSAVSGGTSLSVSEVPIDSEFQATVVVAIRSELSYDNIDEFESVVENAYKTSFVEAYSGYSYVGGYLVERRQIRYMYDSLVRIFPVIHSIMSLTVSHPRGEQIDIFASTNESKNENDPGLCDGEELYEETDDNPPIDGEGETSYEETDDNPPIDGEGETSFESVRTTTDLTKRERAVLEFFIAQIRLRSQRTMRYWAMVPPLANFSRGLLKHPYHPLHGSGCSVLTLWGHLNDLFESTAKIRREVLVNQYTNSVVFDNYQVMVQKKWQTYGCSGNYLKGVASLTKKDKAILLPVGSVLRSPTGVHFEVRSAHFVSEYLTVIEGARVVCDVGVGSYAVISRKQERQQSTRGK